MATQNAVTPKPQTAKIEGKNFNLKVKGADGKWATLGTLFMRDDGTGGVATLYADLKALFLDGMERLEKVAIFVNDGKYAKAKG